MASVLRLQHFLFFLLFVISISLSVTQDTDNLETNVQTATQNRIDVGVIIGEGTTDLESGLLPAISSSRNTTEPNRRPTTTPKPVDPHRAEIPDCPAKCETDFLNDGWCDTECNIKECQFDMGDCEGWCSGDCQPTWPGDGVCDNTCYKEECEFDGGDCKSLEETKTPSFTKVLENKNFDYSKCKCPKSKLGNNRCDQECNTFDCRFDGLDCQYECNKDCPYLWLGDGACDRECDNESCGFDKSDCSTCSEGCRNWKLGNRMCDPDCYNTECEWDNGDCDDVLFVSRLDYSVEPPVYEACAEPFLGDGHCDEVCNVPETKWDADDCPAAANPQKVVLLRKQ